MRLNSYFLLVIPALCLGSAVSAQTGGQLYDFNKAPLKQDVYVQLPLGSIKAKGWLLKQLELQRDGFTGHAEELYPEKENLGAQSDWLGGPGNSWEKVPYYVKGLVALAYTLDDEQLKDKARKWIDYTLDHQQADGLFGPPAMKDWWPRMPFMYALQSYYEATGDKRVIPFLSRYFRYQLDRIDVQPLDSWGRSRAGDNMEMALWVYNKTGDKSLLSLVAKLKEQAYPWIDIFNKNEFFYFGNDYQPRHMVNVAQALKFPPVWSEVDSSAVNLAAMQNGIDHIVHDNGQPHGLGSGTEFMAGRSSIQGVETCTVVEWMQSLETASRILHQPAIGDQLEKIAFNALPAQFSHDLKGHSYYTLPNEVVAIDAAHHFNQDYSTGLLLSPYSGFPCCRYNMHMGWPYFIKNSTLAMPDGGLALNTYGPMEISAQVAQGEKIKITEETNYPFEELIRLKIHLDKAVLFSLQLRIPAWCDQPEVWLNGEKLDGVKSGEMFSLRRKWSSNDQLKLNFPMHLSTQQEVNNGLSMQRGPIVYALKIKESAINSKAFPLKGFFQTEIRPASPWNYGLLLDKRPLADQVSLIRSAMPENPFIAEQSPLQLKLKARQIPSWTMDQNQSTALDVPFSPVTSEEKTEEITLVPYGAEHLRLSIFPLIGKAEPINSRYVQNFDGNTAEGWVVYGGGWFYKDNAAHCAANEDNTSGTNGSKFIAAGTDFSDFDYSAQVNIHSAGDAGLLFRVAKAAIGANAYEGYYVGLNAATQTVTFGKASGGKWIVLDSAKQALEMNKNYTVRVNARGDQFNVYLADRKDPLISTKDAEYHSGSIGLRTYNALATMDNINVRKR